MKSKPDPGHAPKIDKDTPLYSSRIIMIYIEYLKRNYPDLDIDLILESAGMTKYAAEDPGHWFSQDQVNRFHEALVAKTGNENIAREAGRFAVSSERLGPAKQYALGLVNMSFIYLKVGKLANSMTLGSEFKARKLKANKAEIICTPKPGVNEKPYQCSNRLGTLESVPKLFNEAFAVIEHPTCIHNGGDCCRYIVTWPKTPSLKWKGLRNLCLLFSLLTLLTSFFSLSHSSWTMLVLILAYFCLFVAFKLERVEKKELIDTVATQGNVAEALLDEMNTRRNNASLIQEVGQSVSGIVDTDTIAQTVLKIVEKHLKYDCGTILLQNEEKTQIELVANFSYEDDNPGYANKTEIDLNVLDDDALIAECFKKQKPFLVNDCDTIEAKFAQKLVKLLNWKSIQSFICVPLAYKNESLGILVVARLNSNKPLTQSDLSLIIGVASHTAISIMNAVSFRKIRESEAKYRLLADNVSDVIWILHVATLQFSYVSPSVSNMLGYAQNEFLNLPLDVVLTPDSLKLATNTIAEELAIERTSPTNPLRSRTLELEEYCKDGSTIWIEVTASFLRDINGDVSGILGVSRDISERKRAAKEKDKLEKQLQHAQKMEAIGTLAGGVAHDLNNILSGILSYPELLLMDLPPDSPLAKPLETIRESGKKAAAIVQDLLTLARRGVAVADVVNLNDIVSEYLVSPEFEKLRTYHPSIDIKKDVTSDLLNIQGSSVHLFKTVMNLVSNAAEAMPENGVITISTSNQYIEQPSSGDDVQEGDYVVLEVSDTGTGIAKEDLSRIFEPFYTKKVMGRSGTGLGMAVVWGTVRDHKGYIEIDSAEGKGTTFTLYFPVTRKKPGGGKRDFSMADYKGKGESILIIDDVKEQREIASSILTQLGYSVSTVACGEAAVEFMKNNAADMLVLDMIMDPGIDGFETYKQILKLHPKQRAVIASGFSETDRVKETQKLGAGEYVKKPYTIENIGLAIKSEFDKRLSL
ncbi:MAG: ATP-binding protein [Desulfobacterales bacterium]|jgi:PAS domain S-box-containing protein